VKPELIVIVSAAIVAVATFALGYGLAALLMYVLTHLF
jgi:hypothetical protein